MERIERFIKAIEYLKTKAKEPTNEGVAKLLRYKAANYISDVIGGSKELNDLLLERMVEFSINADWIKTGKGSMLLLEMQSSTSQVNEDPADYNKSLPLGDLKVTLKDYIDLWKSMVGKEEDRNKELLAIIKELAAGQKAIAEALRPIKEKTEEILANSSTTLERLSLVETIVRSDDEIIMNNQDRQSGNEVGTSATEAGNRQLAADKRRKGKGNQVDVRK
jgi:hypothetical protein